MGTGELKAAVDAGPLIHLAEIGCLKFLSRFDELHIPEAVWLETVAQGRIAQTDLSILKNIQRHSANPLEIDKFVKENNLSRVHSGEQECLFVCLSKSICTILTDDMAVRAAAKKLGIVPVGSLGVIISAFKGKEITLQEAEQFITDLHDISSLFVTRAIVELAIEKLRSGAK